MASSFASCLVRGKPIAGLRNRECEAGLDPPVIKPTRKPTCGIWWQCAIRSVVSRVGGIAPALIWAT